MREDIAAAAGVSVPDVQQLLLFQGGRRSTSRWPSAQAGSRISPAELRARPAAEPLAAAITGAFDGQYAAAASFELGTSGEWAARIRLIVSAPELRAEYLKSLAVIERSLAEAAAERLGTDLEARSLPACPGGRRIRGLERVAITRWLESGPPAGLRGLLREALAQVLGRPPGGKQTGGDQQWSSGESITTSAPATARS